MLTKYALRMRYVELLLQKGTSLLYQFVCSRFTYYYSSLTVSFEGSATEILLRRYEFPKPVNRYSHLALHEVQSFEECRKFLDRVGSHRSENFNKTILPHCQALIEAAGHRMAYDAAVAEGISPHVIDLFAIQAMNLDPAWYSENLGIGRSQLNDLRVKALDKVIPHLPELIELLNIGEYCEMLPLTSQTSWKKFTDKLVLYSDKGPRIIPML